MPWEQPIAGAVGLGLQRDVILFCDFAERFKGWVRSLEIRQPPDMAASLGEDWEEQREKELAVGALSRADYERYVRPFKARREWLQGVRDDYARNWRHQMETHLGWAWGRGHIPREHRDAYFLHEPREVQEFKQLLEALEQTAAANGWTVY
jgi:hypothetical protein